MNLIKKIYRFFGIHILRHYVNQVIYKILHYSFRIVYSGKKFNITFHGKKITVFSKNYTSYINKPIPLRLIDGSYEKGEIKSIKKFLTKEMTVLELGGSLGVTSVIINSFLNNKKKHIVCEANPKLIKNLEYNKDQNNCEFKIVNQPVSSLEKKVTFHFNDISLGGSIYNKKYNKKYKDNLHGVYKKIVINTITPEKLEKQFKLNFDCLICDIEGEEFNLLLDLFEYFKDFKLMIVEFHFDEESNYQKIKKIKNNYSDYFNIIKINHNNLVFIRKYGS